MSEQWYPLGATMTHRHTPEPGQIMAWNYRAWRIVAVNEVPRDLWTAEDERLFVRYSQHRSVVPISVVLRPPQIVSEDPRARDHDVHVRAYTNHTTCAIWPDEHYPVCGTCQEPLPCKETRIRREVDREMGRIARYDTAGVCPACTETVTHRQKQITFDENLVLPGGPAVTFHLRGQCHDSALNYEKIWCNADPEHRRLTLSCSGAVTTHRDGTYECTADDACPGPTVHHSSMAVCGCPKGTCQGGKFWDCRPLPGMTRRERP